jgi:hypothetical protein
MDNKKFQTAFKEANKLMDIFLKSIETTKQNRLLQLLIPNSLFLIPYSLFLIPYFFIHRHCHTFILLII